MSVLKYFIGDIHPIHYYVHWQGSVDLVTTCTFTKKVPLPGKPSNEMVHHIMQYKLICVYTMTQEHETVEAFTG